MWYVLELFIVHVLTYKNVNDKSIIFLMSLIGSLFFTTNSKGTFIENSEVEKSLYYSFHLTLVIGTY